MKAPIKNYNQSLYPNGDVTQWFGENPLLYQKWGLRGHNGIDIVGPHGSDLYAVEDCIVIYVKEDPSGFGKYIKLLSVQSYDGLHREWTYGHLSEIDVSVGDKVVGGDVVGKMGNTGFVVSGSTPFWKYNPYAGTHLHIGMRLVKLVKSGFRYTPQSPRIEVQNYDNGYKGAVDFAHLFMTNTDSRQKRLLTLISLAISLRDLLILKRNRLNT